ncbi:unnamed protein product [Somion occarium]|uniref:Uncharacterized protein n=1 Tax=Somion occarium TaxID=3059160 RepID=A0ABP1DG49_9APHY
MAYQYYQTSYPGWGQSQLQFGAPPIPNIHPQPHWSGWDYYSAHAINPDPSLFYSVMSRAREYGGTGGVGMHEAQSWHRRIYSGLVPLSQALPTDIGSAAAYEAYRVWRHHHSVMYDCLAGQIEREREGLIGIATAEASHLWQYSGRAMDAYGLREALESAALTASRIAYRVMEDRDGYSGRRGSVVDDDYESDYPDSRDYRRRRRHSSIGSAPSMLGGAPSVGSAYGTPYGTPYATPVPIPTQNPMNAGYGAGGSPYYGGGGLPRSYGGTPSMLGGGLGSQPPYNTNPVIPGAPIGGFSVPYPGSTPSYVGNTTGYPGTTTGYPGATTGYPGSSPYMGAGVQYPSTGYGNTVMAGNIPNVPPGSTVIIQQQPRRRRSSGGHKHHHRSRSSDPLRGYGSSYRM